MAEVRRVNSVRLLLRTRQARRDGDAGAVLRALARGGGDAVTLRMQGRRVLLLLEPQLAGELLAGQAAHTVKGPGQQRIRVMLGDGLLTSEGAAHERARRLVAPAFSPRRLAAYSAVFVRSARAVTADWADGAQRDMHAEMGALTLRAAGQALLGTDLAAQAPLVRAGLDAALRDFGAGGLGSPGPAEGQAIQDGDAGAARGALHALVDDLIAQRRAAAAGAGPAPAEAGDVLSALLNAPAGREPGTAGGLTDGEIHDHVMTLLLAGHETTASALSWTLYLTAQHPEVQRRLRAEVGALDGEPPGPGTLPSLRYTRAVVSEAVRLYPPAWIIGRTVTAPVELAGRVWPAGSVAAVSPLLLQRDPRWWPDPETFDPGRWLDARAAAVPRHAYLPFGTGPRTCIGEQFAWAEAVTVLATLAQRWTFQAVPGPAPVPGYRVTLRPAGPLPLTVRAAAG